MTRVLVQGMNTSAIAKLKRYFAVFLITIDFGTSQISTQIRAFSSYYHFYYHYSSVITIILIEATLLALLVLRRR
jgi:hypothetical protein